MRTGRSSQPRRGGAGAIRPSTAGAVAASNAPGDHPHATLRCEMPFDRRRIDEILVRRLVTAQFPRWARLEVRPVELDGWDNRTFRLGEELSARPPTGDWYAEQVAKERRWLPVLAPALPLPIPVPVGQGRPGEGFPYPWSVYRWLEGAPAAVAPADKSELALDLARFLRALAACDATDGPPPGRHNFFRGAPLAHYEAEALAAIDALGDAIPRAAVLRTWQRATASRWEREPVWFHGDVAAGNLLVRDRRLVAVIDFGTSGVGDPACDVVIAWT